MNRLPARPILLALAATALACSGGGPSESNPTPPPTAKPGPAPAPAPASAAPVGDDPAVANTPEPAAKPKPPPPPPPLVGRNFGDLARRYYKIAACADPTAAATDGPGDDAARAKDAAKLTKYLAGHCVKLQGILDRFENQWRSKAAPFFAELVPEDIPKTIVYPFGGADLITVLTVFPGFEELTTLSLEPVGDPRGIDELKRGQFQASLDRTRTEFGYLVAVNHNKTLNMIEFMRSGKLPAHLIFSLTALRVHGYEPTSLRYFDVEPDGSLRYLTDEEIAKLDVRNVRKRNQFFGSAEIRFKKIGGGPERVYRHIQGNLDNDHLRKDPRLLVHLQAKGEITAITKAASFLLSSQGFSKVRDYLLDNMQWMVSDATGIPPKYAERNGFEQVTWGKFVGPLFGGAGRYPDFIKLWKTNPAQKLPIRFGYPDSKRNNHLMVTQKTSAGAAASGSGSDDGAADE